eukprot:15281492-Ditylum_brightwellii.AAC.1
MGDSDVANLERMLLICILLLSMLSWPTVLSMLEVNKLLLLVEDCLSPLDSESESGGIHACIL